MFQGCCIKVFSRKQECPALSSAEAELCAMTENLKELVSLGMLLESILDGIPLTILELHRVRLGLTNWFVQRCDGGDQHYRWKGCCDACGT